MNDEQALVRQIVQGNVRAYQTLVERYQRLVLHMIRRIVQQPADVEDVCQDVFMKVYQQLPTYQFEAKLSTWIATIAYRTGINYVKKHHRESFHHSFDQLDDTDILSQLPNPEDVVQQDDWHAFLHRQIDRLPIHYRTVLTLYHLEELSYEEIGQITSMPEGTVKNYLFRARRLLKNALEAHQTREKNYE
ncbi:RNA polymerase sigma factor [Spirosoma sp. BT702]|uniref:RNA polymerase sigma factor n=1 Tax=Spirosoma profusum TaxID=2771354 RepID=A0A927AQF2_9BACT|nr:RNA polymerase sigma factor [Spirosoma profusum]MBD2700271.1 RNA polymerase sigma factor [Spirosoma profusum]